TGSAVASAQPGKIERFGRHHDWGFHAPLSAVISRDVGRSGRIARGGHRIERCRAASTRPAHRDSSDGTRSGLVGSRGSTAQYAADAATAGNEAGVAVDRTFTT